MKLNKIELIGIPEPNTIELHKNNKIKTDDVSNTNDIQFNIQNEISDYYNNDFSNVHRFNKKSNQNRQKNIEKPNHKSRD